MNLEEVFYVKEGKLFWKIDPWGKGQKDTEAGFTDARGYRRVTYKQKTYFVHRVIYTLCVGSIPEGYEVDHKNRDPRDNSLENLRLATPSQNTSNRRLFSNSTTGYKGVCLHKQTGKYVAHIRVQGKRLYLGLHETIEEAFAAYTKAADFYQKEFANIEGK